MSINGIDSVKRWFTTLKWWNQTQQLHINNSERLRDESDSDRISPQGGSDVLQK